MRIMNHKRIHVRVPVRGEALLSTSGEAHITARAIDISLGGVAIASPAEPLTEDSYDIVITTEGGNKIELKARLIRQEGDVLGFKITQIDDIYLQIIRILVFKYQESIDFIKQIEEHHLLDHWFLDEEGNELEITFFAGPEKT